jgi:hypothetical protein
LWMLRWKPTLSTVKFDSAGLKNILFYKCVWLSFILYYLLSYFVSCLNLFAFPDLQIAGNCNMAGSVKLLIKVHCCDQKL